MKKSLITVVFNGLDYYTLKPVSVTKTITFDDMNFVDIVKEPLVINGGELTIPSYTLTAFEQADEHLSRCGSVLQDVIDNPAQELHCIVDWKITAIQNFGEGIVESNALMVTEKEPETVESMLSVITPIMESESGEPVSEKFKTDFLHTYEEIKDTIKDLPIDKQFHITMSAMGVGYLAATTATQHAIELLKSISNPLEREEAKRYIEHQKRIK